MSCLHTMMPNTYRLKKMLHNLPPQGRQSHASPLRTGPRVSSTCIKHLRQVMQWCGCVYETNQETETWCIIVRHTTWPTPTYVHTLTTVHSEEVLSTVRKYCPWALLWDKLIPNWQSSCFPVEMDKVLMWYCNNNNSTFYNGEWSWSPSSGFAERSTDRRFGYGYVEVGTMEGRCKFVTRGQLNSKEENPIPVW